MNSTRYTIENLKTMREAAGLGVLSMGVCAISGELVSSTPIPGSRCGHAGQDTAEYGGYLLGEGMTREAALYFANLHNHFPTLAEAVEKRVDEWDQDAVAYLERISVTARAHGWGMLDGTLADWIAQRLENQANQTACVVATVEENQALKQELLRYYHADGTFNLCQTPEEAVERRIAAAGRIQELEDRLQELADLAKELISGFTESGSIGSINNSLRHGWVHKERVEHWRCILDGTIRPLTPAVRRKEVDQHDRPL